MARYRIAWEDPAEPEAPLKITAPSDRWLMERKRDGMTEEQATMLCAQITLPQRCFEGNKTHFVIVPVEAIPTDRTNRNAWRLGDLT